MKYNQLGQSKLRVSQVSFGCMSLTGNLSENTKLLNKALDKGINFFDTADLYDKGNNERMVGAAFKEKRQQVILATKVGNQWRPDGSGWEWNPTKDYILQAVEQSLRRLQTDYIDLYQLHGGTIEDRVEETIEAFEQLQQQGKIRYYGISSIRPNVIREYVQKSNLVSVMLQYSLLDRRPEEQVLDLLSAHKIGVLARGTLAQGILAGKPAKNYLSYSQSEAEALAATLAQEASALKQKNHTIAACFVLDNPTITSAVMGIRTKEQLQDALAISQAGPIPQETMDKLKKVLSPNHYELHR